MELADWVRNLPGRRFAREFSWVGAGQLATVMTRLVGVRVLTELVEPSVFGVVGLTLGVAVLARNVFCAPILEASYRFFAEAAHEGRISQHRALLTRLLRTRAFLAGGALLLGGAGWAVWTGAPGAAWSFAAVGLLTLLEAFRMFELRLLNAARRQMHHAGWSLADEALRFGCAIAATQLFGPEAVWVLLGYAAGVLLGIALFWSARVRTEGEAADPAWTRQRRAQVARYALPLSLLAVVGWLFNFSDRFVLAAVVGTEPTGVYVAAYGLASQPFLLATTVLGLTFRPVYNAAAVRGDRRREREVFLVWLGITVAVLSIGVVLLSWLAEPLTALLLAKQYAGAAELLPWIGAAYALQGCRQIFDSVVYAQTRTTVLVVVQLIAAPTTVALYLLLIPRMAALGAAIATLAGMAVALAAVALLSGALPRLLFRPAREVTPP
jgi:O-antigen/teichoic acid export membrane protein